MTYEVERRLVRPARVQGQAGMDRAHMALERRPVVLPSEQVQTHDELVRVSVVIPARNEAKNLPYVLTRLPHDVHEVILVDGHSTDDTIAVAQRLYSRITILPQEGRGKGNALAAGFEACTGDIIVMVDADGSADPSEIPRFVATLCTGADFAKGSRSISGGGSADLTRIRSAGNRALCTLVNLLFHARYSDLCYGYNAFWRSCLPYMDVDCDGFEIETLINIRIAQSGLQVHEVPSFEGVRVHGVSNLSAVRDGLRVLRTILLERQAHTHTRPVKQRHVMRPGYGWDGQERRSRIDRRNRDDRRADDRPWTARRVGRRAADRSILHHGASDLTQLADMLAERDQDPGEPTHRSHTR